MNLLKTISKRSPFNKILLIIIIKMSHIFMLFNQLYTNNKCSDNPIERKLLTFNSAH